MFGITAEGAEFWNHFTKVVCERDARINSFFDSSTIYNVFVALSRITRKKPANVGPISQCDLQDAFEAVVGQLPVEDASVMLQRLPSLGRIGPESQDRQFIDMFILDGLRAKDVERLPEADADDRRRAAEDQWTNPLGRLGQTILALGMAGRFDKYVQIANRSAPKNPTMASDIAASLARLSVGKIDLQGLQINNGTFSELDFRESLIENFSISDSTIEQLILPNYPPKNVKINTSLVGNVAGAASFSGLPSWVKLEGVDKFDSVQTVSQIRKAGLSPSLEILVAVLKKTFRQKGAGRKEEALLRGFGSGASGRLASRILSILMREKILDRHKGDEGWIYSPIRSETARIDKMLDQLRSSDDQLWKEIESLSK